MFRPHHLGQHQGGHFRHDGRRNIRHGQFQRAIDAYANLLPMRGNGLGRSGQRRTRGFLLTGGDGIFQIKNDHIRAARMRLGNKTLGNRWNEQQRPPAIRVG